MDFFKKAASFVESNKSNENSGTTGEDFDVSDLMSKAEGFLAEKKPEAFAHESQKAPELLKGKEEEEEKEEVVRKPLEETEEAPKPAATKEDTEEQVLEEPATTESSAKPVKEESSPVPKTTSSEVPPQSSAPDAKPSYSELYGSAQTLYSGLRGKLGGKTDVDNQQLASAAEDLVEGAESLGLLKPDSPYGDYFKKAESYLHDNSSSDSAPKKPTLDESA